MTPDKDAAQSYAQMAIVEKYETVISYLYPIAQSLPRKHGVNFLGYRIWPRHKLLRKQSVTAAKRKIAHYTKHGNTEALTKFTASWRGHAAHADTCNLFNHLKEHHAISCH